jgi:hypothetical protein
LADQVKEKEVGGTCDTYGRGERNCTRFWWESPKERDLMEDRGIDGRMGSERILGRLSRRRLSGFIWLRIGASGGVL